ncbi:hypothetical protein E2562_025812 [Oryza meyeriana var. granulata]|uniref:CG-1 domain-containing protein n=1 Tax=Oryza meyeriana var. granulata TaxID=110450 RepID=A0A6G1E298_9ORYZ|nr:hypothetical protein E2562_025812 [Oryza meyeriana var. granulata]
MVAPGGDSVLCSQRQCIVSTTPRAAVRRPANKQRGPAIGAWQADLKGAHNWRKKKDGKIVKEAHEKMKRRGGAVELDF